MEAPQSIEATGTTVEDAIGRGLEALNAARNEVDILILTAEPGRTARVRLTRKPREAEPVTTTAPAAQSVAPDEALAAQHLLQAVLDRMKYRVQIVQRDPADLNGYDEQDEPTLVLDIRGGDLSTLIGRRGETLDGLQYLVRLLVAKELSHYVHVVLDVEGYKAHRAQMLKQLALRMADRVATTHKPAALEPMPANERRIVHLALRDHTQVRTESVGMGENRKVTIIPQSYKR
ncbi:MAG TPA: RNA-binding cell elongation regulator Jag/EloR [Anaerolineae bacterium]|nr:RNA-binding cell elongation regulator Jag/EloR [Anaerolineae bacterium]